MSPCRYAGVYFIYWSMEKPNGDVRTTCVYNSGNLKKLSGSKQSKNYQGLTRHKIIETEFLEVPLKL